MSESFTILQGLNIIDGWKRISVTNSINSLAMSFSLTLSETWSDSNNIWVIDPDLPIEIYAGSTKILTGYVDDIGPSLSDGKQIEFKGRSLAGDLVDCSADLGYYSVKDQTLIQIIETIADPFSVPVSKNFLVDVGPVFPKFDWDPGETCYDIINRAVKARGLLVYSDPDGGLYIDEPGFLFSVEDIEEGVNLLKGARAKILLSNRFSSYRCLSSAPGSDDGWGSDTNEIEGEASDDGVYRHRPLVFQHEGSATTEEAALRAKNEAAIRAAKSVEVDCAVQGVRRWDLSLWSVNELVNFESGSLGFSRSMLVTDVTLSQDEGGTIARLKLAREDAYTLQESVPVSSDPKEDLFGW